MAESGHRGTRAIERMLEHAPASGSLALWVHHADLPADPIAPGSTVPTPLATDGHTLCYGPSFDTIPLDEQAGRVAHAVLHVALRHAQRQAALQRLTGDVDPQLFNTCADAIVNTALGHLAWLRLPEGAVTLEGLLFGTMAIHEDVGRLLLAWDVERLYRTLDDREAASGPRSPRRDGPRASRTRTMGAGTPRDLQPVATDAEAPEAEAELARDWSERLLRGHAGDGAFSMLRGLIADLPRVHTPWEQVLRTRLARGLALRPERSWSRPSRSYLANQGRGGPNRRMPWEPGITASRRSPRLAVIVDVSGSVDDGLLERFAREIEAITRRAEAGLVMIVGDDRVRHVAHYAPGTSGLRGLALQGGGGTDFTPLLEAADTHRPDLGVVLTDLQGPARFTPRWPVIWAVPPAFADATPPFGRRLVLH
jgi:hypothetical protein